MKKKGKSTNFIKKKATEPLEILYFFQCVFDHEKRFTFEEKYSTRAVGLKVLFLGIFNKLCSVTQLLCSNCLFILFAILL